MANAVVERMIDSMECRGIYEREVSVADGTMRHGHRHFRRVWYLPSTRKSVPLLSKKNPEGAELHKGITFATLFCKFEKFDF